LLTSKEMPSTAVKAPKRLVRSDAERTIDISFKFQVSNSK
jgi:hypothetical protein